MEPERKEPRQEAIHPLRGRGRPPSNTRIRRYLAILFWLTFIIVIYGLFLFNRETITDSIQIVRNERSERENVPVAAPPPVVQPPAGLPPPVAVLPPHEPAALVQPVIAQPEPLTPVADIAPQPQIVAPPEQPPQGAMRTIYFTQVDRNGMVFRAAVNRSVPITNTPLTDTLNALIEGPNDDEVRRGLITLIPPGTRVLSAAVRDGTAYISFSEEFRFNTYGVEGYLAQLRQIVYTATEFPTVIDVQILIEGNRLSFMGEGIWVGSPIRRGAF